MLSENDLKLIESGFKYLDLFPHTEQQEIIRLYGYDDEKAKEVYIQKEINKLYKTCKLGERFKTRTFETYRTDNIIQKKAKNVCYEYAYSFKTIQNDETNSLLILGNGKVGTGKTHLTCSIANYIINKLFIPVKYGNIINLFEELKENNFQNQKEVIKTLTETPLLLIDDLGKENISEFTKAIVYQVINNRYEACKPMVVNCEQNLEFIEKRYGDSIRSRLVQISKAVKLDCEDFRMNRSL